MAVGIIFAYFVDSLWFAVFVFVVWLLFVGPGLYSMIKGAPYLPSKKVKIDVMLNFAELKGDEVVYDLGCGDGRVVRAFKKAGVARAIGVEFSVFTYAFAVLTKVFSVTKEEYKFGNFWKMDFSDADVLICFLLDTSMERFKKEIWPSLKVGTKVLVNEFPMEGIKADREEKRVYLYLKK